MKICSRQVQASFHHTVCNPEWDISLKNTKCRLTSALVCLFIPVKPLAAFSVSFQHWIGSTLGVEEENRQQMLGILILRIPLLCAFTFYKLCNKEAYTILISQPNHVFHSGISKGMNVSVLEWQNRWIKSLQLFQLCQR